MPLGYDTASADITPARFNLKELLFADRRRAAQRAGLRDLKYRAMLDLRLADGACYRDDFAGGEEKFEGRLDMLASISRTGVAFNPNWSFRSGDPVGRLEEVAAGVLRYNQPPNTAGGRLLESTGATNKGRNPRFEGATAGALDGAGVLPSNVTVTGIADSAVSVVSTGYASGWPYLRIRLNGTPSSAPRIILEGLTQIAAATASEWTHSVGLALAAGSLTNVASVGVRIAERTSGGADVAAGSNDVTPDATHRRYVYSRTLSGGGTVAAITHEIIVNWSTGAIDVTLDILLPQIESGLAATSPVMPDEDDPAESTRGGETLTDGFAFTRASRAHAAKWDWSNGGQVGPLKEFLPNTMRQVEGAGLFVEPAVTCKNRNSRHLGAVAGTPGTAPTHHIVSGGGASTEIVGSGIEDGWPYVDVRWFGTPSGRMYMRFEGQTQIVVATGQKWCTTVGMRLTAGTLANITETKIRMDERTSGGSFVVGKIGPAIALDRSHRRFWHGATLDGGGTVERLDPQVEIVYDGSGDVDFTIRFYAAQITNTLTPRQPVLPEPNTTGEATRAAEMLTMTTTMNALGRSLYIEGFTLGETAGSTNWLLTLYKDAVNFGGYDLTNNLLYLDDYSPSGYFASNNPQAAGIGEVVRAAYCYAANDMAFSREGFDQVFDTSGSNTIDTATLGIGNLGGSASATAFCFSEIRIFPDRIEDEDAEALVSNAA
ncbi:MAG: hypothetical protein GC208_09805 [Alphaproteobacteria bacterium]|nr:hypothetical protein [Alphaproteobacteria bacterium]